MTQTERIKQVLVDYTKRNHIMASSVILEQYAEELVNNGVIVPPCKVGDITYIFDYEVNNHLETKFRGITPSIVEAITIVDDGLWIENEHAKYHISSVGDLMFLTREEAEKALERSENGT